MYYFAVAGMFKNEAHILKEWIEHYRFHGADHIYLINDGSTDNYLNILDPYIKEGYVTLFQCDIPHRKVNEVYQGRQTKVYMKYLQPYFKDIFWLATLDLDEFLYCPNSISIPNVLKKFEDVTQLQVNWVWFGSNNLEKQPKSVVQGFTKRAFYTRRDVRGDTCHGPKTIVNASKIVKLNIHGHDTTDGKIMNVSWMKDMDNSLMLINHYALQSRELFFDIKSWRLTASGDADDWHMPCQKGLDYFNRWDFNDCDDFRLYEQNKEIIEKL